MKPTMRSSIITATMPALVLTLLAFALGTPLVAQNQAGNSPPAAPSPNNAPDNAAGDNSAADNASDASRDESASSMSSSSSPNMIGDFGSGPGYRSTLPISQSLGAVQTGSFTLPVLSSTTSKTSNSIVISTKQFSLYNSPVPSTTFSYNSFNAPTNPAAIPLTNTDSAYNYAATQALTNYYKSKNTANQQISTVTISSSGAQASEISSGNTSAPRNAYTVTQFYQYQYLEIPSYVNINIPSPSGGFIGRQRISDNESPVPQDRVFFDYSYFNDAFLSSSSPASRFVPGFEKTFFDGRTSIEMRVPMGVMQSNNITADESSYASTGQFGDIEVIGKAILAQDDLFTLSAGLGISVPTAPDVNVDLPDGTPLAKIANRSTHLLPFVGLLVKPNDLWFAQAFIEVDVAANGNPVSINATGAGLSSVGDINDQALVFCDLALGRWLYHDPSRRFSGLAAVVEAHYTGGVDSPGAVQASNFTIGDNSYQFNVVDLTVGGHATLGNATFTLGYATPVTEDRAFEGELRCFVNWTF